MVHVIDSDFPLDLGGGGRQRKVDELNQQCGKNRLSPALEAL